MRRGTESGRCQIIEKRGYGPPELEVAIDVGQASIWIVVPLEKIYIIKQIRGM